MIKIDMGITLCYPYGMKTAISIPDQLFEEVEKFAQEHNYSRSEVFVIAIKDFLEKLQSKKLLEAINKAYSDVELQEEKTIREESKKHYSKRVLKDRNLVIDILM